jgi:hypothetical protein
MSYVSNNKGDYISIALTNARKISNEEGYTEILTTLICSKEFDEITKNYNEYWRIKNGKR